jgi:hypothetical protein
MAKKEGKSLLNEGTIRRFMKLAEIGGLSDNFVGDLYERDEEEEDLPPEGLETGAEEDLPPEPGAEEPPLEEPGLEEPGAEMEPAPPEGGMGEDELNQFVEDVIAGVAQAAADLGVDVDVEGAAGRAGAGEEELGLGGEEELGLGGEEELGLGGEEELGLGGEEEPALGGEEELGLGGEEEEEEELPPGRRGMYEGKDEALVNEIAKRVAARLIRVSRAAKK